MPGSLLQLLHEPNQYLPGKKAPSPMYRQRKSFANCLGSTFADLFLFGEGQLPASVIALGTVGTGGNREENRLMIPEYPPVIQIEIVIPQEIFSCKGTVKGGVQMIILSFQADDVPGMAIFDPFVRGGFGDGDDTPKPQSVTENFDSFCNPFTYPYSLAQRTDNYVRICFFQFVISNIAADEVVDILLLFNLTHIFGPVSQPSDPGGERLLMLPDFAAVKKIIRQHGDAGGVGMNAAGKAGDIGNLRVIPTKPK